MSELSVLPALSCGDWERHLEQVGIEAKGRVEEFRKIQSGNLIVFTFQDQAGNDIQHRLGAGSRRYQVGDDVGIIFDPNKPRVLMLDTAVAGGPPRIDRWKRTSSLVFGWSLIVFGLAVILS